MRIPVQELVEMYKNNIYAAAFNICKSAADAEDVVQDTFLQYYMTKNYSTIENLDNINNSF